MSATRTAEVRTITVAVSDVPDLLNYRGDIAIVPTLVELTYRWFHPDDRKDWHTPGSATADVSGPRRLKSGKPGADGGRMTITFAASYGNVRPQWLVDLVAEYMPDGWDA